MWEPEPGRRLRLGAGAGREAIALAPSRRPRDDLAARAEPAPARLADGDGPRRWRVVNPSGAHAVACGLDAELEVEIDGHVGYYCAGMNKHATVRVRATRASASPRT